ncbi:MAG: DUF1801 domain-containing protein [Patescibacteria group bacterium]
MKQVSSVDEYIASCPKEYQAKLQELRKIIVDVAPNAEEKISYAMPYYGYNGRLVYFALAKHHIGLYLMPPTIEDHKEALKGYVITKSSLHLYLDKELPVDLIKKLIKVGMKRNEEKLQK